MGDSTINNNYNRLPETAASDVDALQGSQDSRDGDTGVSHTERVPDVYRRYYMDGTQPVVRREPPPRMNMMSLLQLLQDSIMIARSHPEAGPAIKALFTGAVSGLLNGSGRVDQEHMERVIAALTAIDTPEVAREVAKMAKRHLHLDPDAAATLDRFLDKPENFAPLVDVFASEFSLSGDKIDDREMRMLLDYARQDDGDISEAELVALRRLLARVPMTDEAQEMFESEFPSRPEPVAVALYGVALGGVRDPDVMEPPGDMEPTADDR